MWRSNWRGKFPKQALVAPYANNQILRKDDIPYPVETVHNAREVKHDGR